MTDYVRLVNSLINIDEHGGGCCGMSHLHNFPSYSEMTNEERVTVLKGKIENIAASANRDCECDVCDDPDCDCDNKGECRCPPSGRHCIEVVLNESQLHPWCKPLEEVGFKQVFSFLNSNSGNECHVFLMETGL